MELTDKQYALAQMFFNEHLPGQRLAGGFAPQTIYKQKFLDIEPIYALYIAQSLWEGLLREKPHINTIKHYDELEREMFRRAKKVFSLNERAKQVFSKIYGAKTDAGFTLLMRQFKEMGKLGIPFRTQVRSVENFLKIAPIWAKTKPRLIKNFRIEHDFSPHSDAVLSLNIRSKENHLLATIGGFLEYGTGKPKLHITNVQGVKLSQRNLTDEEFKKRKEEHIDSYKKLNEALGENWRVFFTKEIKTLLNKKNIHVIGHLPQRFHMLGPTVSDSEYKRQTRQAKQTFRKSGFKEQPDKTWIAKAKQKRKRKPKPK